MGLVIYFVIVSFMCTFHVETSDLRVFVYIEEQKTKDQASRYCREKHTDLATFINEEETQKVQNVCGSSWCWISLYRENGDGNVWVWGNGVQTNFTVWRIGQPDNNGGNEDCVIMVDGRWIDVPCYRTERFICYEDNLILVKENKTWENAMEHCRNHTSLDSSYSEIPNNDLISLHSSEDQSYARILVQEAETDEVWIGLCFLAGQWLWLDGKPLWYTDLTNCPANGRECGTVVKTGGMKATKNCEERRNFLCSKKPKL